MPRHASSGKPQKPHGVAACLIAGALIAVSTLPVFDNYSAWFWGAALVLLIGGLLSVVGSPTEDSRAEGADLRHD